MYVLFVMPLLEDGHTSGRNMYEMYCVCNIVPYTVSASVGFDIISNSSV
jgi:hypothetical protein